MTATLAPRRVVLVEGESDRRALLTYAARLGRDLDREGVDVVAMSGVTNIRAHACELGPLGLGLPLMGLYDSPDESTVRRGLAAAGIGGPVDDPALHGFFGCSVDLEDELIRALGPDAVEAVIESAGDTRSLRLLRQMPAQQGWSREAVLRRFLGVRSGRKARYAELLVDALELDRAPEPLAALLGRI
jgi:hypothetical protein